jgi:hypothetical protein
VLRLLTIAACALVVGGGFAVPRLAFAPSAPRHKAPGRMLDPEAPIPIPPSVLRMRNGWLASDARTLVAVYAGSAGDDPTLGRLVVVRQNLASGSQTVRIVGVGRTGALAIVAARLRGSGDTVALQVRTAGGRLLRRDLSRRTAARSTLTRSSRSAATVPRPRRPRSSDQVSFPHDR